ncbi:chemotaxis protein CheW [Clostridium tepidiprofundi DSM 19306]|uniref:Chemotaxis protein CheW n=1 Tax=Clostridium tepidiprofundi DSM 19306 TaxID=1121338 RepID=A0A151B4E0_9CLOT|nr:chemotaxis protein CheW [Clostridium tepidiprofundi]KYH34784.1 chemotaxis protein CheW [Clostridium tepidiprofundi DSM 19306]
MSDNALKILIFNIKNENYAASIMEIERILGYQEPTRVPDVPQFVEGVINYEGSILPVISIAKKFGLSNSGVDGESKIIVVKQHESKIGILVDSVSEVMDIDMSVIEEPPEIISGISKRYLKGLVKCDEKIIILLNLSAILTEEEKEKINI